MTDAERDLATKLDWIAVDHWNTDNPHIHVLVRGKADDGRIRWGAGETLLWAGRYCTLGGCQSRRPTS